MPHKHHSLDREIPFDATVLRFCRCRDCRKLTGSPECWWCKDGIGGTGAIWGTGERVTDPDIAQWHYCVGYDGPRNDQKPMVWSRRDVPDLVEVQKAETPQRVTPEKPRITKPTHVEHVGR